jgi:AraC-like DNA-binding protein
MNKPIRKSFFNDPMFPFEMVYQDRKAPQHELPEHIHDRYELVYVYEGRGTFFLNHGFYDMHEGDLFIIPGNTIHRAFPDAEFPVTSTAIFFSPSLVQLSPLGDTYSNLHSFDLAKKRSRYKLHIPEAIRVQFLSIVEQIKTELLEKKIGYKHAVCLHLQNLLLQTNRLSSLTQADIMNTVPMIPEWMQNLLQYIDSHHTNNDLRLSVLAERVSVSAAHLSRAFKQLTGMNVTDYVNAKRIVNAKELLLTTDDPVELIARSCGYESLPHFHRLFKLLTGVTPASYRRIGGNIAP